MEPYGDVSASCRIHGCCSACVMHNPYAPRHPMPGKLSSGLLYRQSLCCRAMQTPLDEVLQQHFPVLPGTGSCNRADAPLLPPRFWTRRADPLCKTLGAGMLRR